MSDRYFGYRIETSRHPGWDYGDGGMYFVTICVEDRRCCLGDIFQNNANRSEDNNPNTESDCQLGQSYSVDLSPSGIIVRDTWKDIPRFFPEIFNGDFIVMPNHIHGILGIPCLSKNDGSASDTRPLIASGIETGKAVQPSFQGGATGRMNPMLHSNLSRIVRWFKGRATYQIRKFDVSFKWQSRFFDSIIMDDYAYRNVCRYMEENPDRWHQANKQL